MRRPVFSFRPRLENPNHRRAWEILQGVPEGQKNAFLVQAILQAEDAEQLSSLIRKAIHEELKEIQIAVPEQSAEKAGEIPGQMLDFLSSIEDGM